jgi:hypothetical protein
MATAADKWRAAGTTAGGTTTSAAVWWATVHVAQLVGAPTSPAWTWARARSGASASSTATSRTFVRCTRDRIGFT